MNLKSERLKKLESELEDLKKWLDLGLVPKKDIEKHKQEMNMIEDKVEEEKGRLRFLKENGDLEEYVAPKKTGRQAYAEPHTMPDLESGGGASMTDLGMDFEEGGYETESTMSAEKEKAGSELTTVEDDDPFSDRNRWKRGILEDPDVDNW